MAVPTAPLALLLEVAVVVVALVGVTRLAALRALADDVRLRRLSWFFGLFAAAVAAQLIATVLLIGHGRAPAGPLLRQLNVPTLIYHGLMLGALIVALRAFALPWRPPPPVAAALIFVGRFGVLGLAEAALTLYLAIASFVNQRHRRTRGSLRVAAGFLLFFLGHLSFWVFQRSGVVRPFWAEALTLAGIVLLVASVPRRKPVPPSAGGAA